MMNWDPEDQLSGFCSVGLLEWVLVSVPRRPNLRRLAALLQPEGKAGLKGDSPGRRISITPSKSTGSQWWSCTAKESLCSLCF
ncbi:hypothetical protein C8E87_4952 [Paractinoplanes brasiliensis]|uniref:Uncharacterized protein n=1 Tax=Paractinoplanes brasiliensis TaxID=52695 RepID=A0A4R6JWR1_9ACTN|nr:hypothetical protein C8E87_4952 [Actinoplanes brasiliensis]